jgi:hypothetical protein
MKVLATKGFDVYLSEAIKLTAKTDFRSFGEFIADRNRMSEVLLEEIEKDEPVKPVVNSVFMAAGDFLELHSYGLDKA